MRRAREERSGMAWRGGRAPASLLRGTKWVSFDAAAHGASNELRSFLRCCARCLASDKYADRIASLSVANLTSFVIFA